MEKEKLLLKGGKILGEDGTLEVKSILISGNKIEEIGTDIPEEGVIIHDVSGKLIIPGLIDMHAHLRDPGAEDKESVETGLWAAVKGGYTSVACMPNTNPVMDCVKVVEYVQEKAKEFSNIKLYPIPAITNSMLGSELTDFRAFKKMGVVGVTDDGVGVQEDEIMEQALLEAKKHNLIVMQHPEYLNLSIGGVFHDGDVSEKFEMKGIPSMSEYKMVARDINLVRKTEGRYHALHLSTYESVKNIKMAKGSGLNVTAEVTPHHLVLCQDDIKLPEPNFVMRPPLRTKEDQDALIAGLNDGTIDIIATDHAPHSEKDKNVQLKWIPPGVIGLETSFAILYTKLVLTGKVSLKTLVDALTCNPAKIFNIPGGELREGLVADIAVIDIENSVEVQADSFQSKSQNSPFIGMNLKGNNIMTISDGKVAFKGNYGI